VLFSAIIETYILPKTDKAFLLVLIPGYNNVNNERDQAYRQYDHKYSLIPSVQK